MSAKHEPFVLNAAERNSGLWQRILVELRYRLEVHRMRNESPDMTEMQRGMLLGRIAEDKEVLRWDEPPKELPK